MSSGNYINRNDELHRHDLSRRGNQNYSNTDEYIILVDDGNDEELEEILRGLDD